MSPLIIAVDFDGTIVEHEFPGIGKAIPFALSTLIEMWSVHECKLILWTCRCGYELAQALEWCAKRGLKFDAVNSNAYGPVGYGVPKVVASVYIDDRNIEYRARPTPGLVAHDWVEIRNKLLFVLNNRREKE